MFDIEDLFIHTINKYINKNCSIKTIEDIPLIIQFNSISKLHYAWIKKTEWYLYVQNIIIAYKWLDVQKIRKSVNSDYHELTHIIKSWSGQSITVDNVTDAVLLYNKIKGFSLKGNYPCYNLCYKYIYPSQIPLEDDHCQNDYKNFPYINTIYNYSDCRDAMIQTKNSLRKVRKKDIVLYKENPLFYRKVFINTSNIISYI